MGSNHPTAVANLAALVEFVATNPDRRIVNSADPDAPNALSIERTSASLLGQDWTEVLLDEALDTPLGRHPWGLVPAITLDTSAAVALGYVPVGNYAITVAEQVKWLVTTWRVGIPTSWLPEPDASYLTVIVGPP